MLHHIRWLNVRAKLLHSLSPHMDRQRSIRSRLGHLVSSSWNSRLLWKPNSQLSLRESKCVQNEKLCSLDAGISKKENLHIQSRSQVSLNSQCSCEAGLNAIESQEQIQAFFKHNNVPNKHGKRQHLRNDVVSRGTTSISRPIQRFYYETASIAMPWRSYCTGNQYHTGLQYHNSGSEAAKWKQGTQPGLDMKYFLNIGDFENKLYDYLCDADGRLPISKFKAALVETGLRESDPRLEDCMRMIVFYQSRQEKQNGFGTSQHEYIDRDSFKKCISQNIVVLSKAFRSRFIIPDFQPFCQHIDDIYWKARDTIGGNVATYIPQLSRYSPNLWGVSVCTVDGQRYSLGDVNTPFTIQSVSKPLSYGLVLDDLTPDVVHQYVGHEPSGVAFNSIGLNYKDQPHNPMVNAGAIVIGSLLKQELSLPDRFDYVSGMFQRLAGGEYVAFNNSVFLSERQTADRNFALAYYMREKKCFPEGINLTEVMDFYFQLCSIEITAESGSVIASTLANGGVCPITGDKVLSTMAVRDILSLMHSCGMYDYSGEFAFKVGLPAKSGVSGGILLVVPNIMGIFMWSPALDAWGNSVRGVQFCQDLVGKFNFHNYDNLRYTSKKLDPCKRKEKNQTYDVVNLLFGAYNGDVSALRRFAMRDVDMNQSDYDGRTALHIGAAEGHEGVVRFLLEKCRCNPFVVDRWGSTPDKDAERFGHKEIVKIIHDSMATYPPDDNNLNSPKKL